MSWLALIVLGLFGLWLAGSLLFWLSKRRDARQRWLDSRRGGGAGE